MCAAWRGRAGWVAALIGLAAGGFGYWALGDSLMQSQPVEVQIRSVDVIAAPPGTVERTLHVKMESPPSPFCTRLSQQLMYRDNAAGVREYYPLGSSLNGVGFPGSKYDFTLILSLPSAMPAGDYQYIQRSAYSCSWIGGFIQRRIAYQSKPMTVHVVAN